MIHPDALLFNMQQSEIDILLQSELDTSSACNIYQIHTPNTENHQANG